MHTRMYASRNFKCLISLITIIPTMKEVLSQVFFGVLIIPPGILGRNFFITEICTTHEFKYVLLL